MSKNERVQPRNARTPKHDEQPYVIADGAPTHYVDGYGLVRGGAIVTLAPGVTPGRWMVEVAPEDAAKARASESDAQRLAVMAAAKIKARGNSADVERKREADKIAQQKAEQEAMEAAKREADAMKKAADAEEAAQSERDRAEQERERADAAERRAREAEEALAKLQKEQAAQKESGKGGK